MRLAVAELSSPYDTNVANKAITPRSRFEIAIQAYDSSAVLASKPEGAATQAMIQAMIQAGATGTS